MEYEIKLTEQDVQLVLQALGELPLKVTVNTFMKINGQIAAHRKPQASLDNEAA